MGRSTYARRKERGQELVEFALILPLLLLLLVGIFEFGYVVFVQNSLSNAVREGARYGAVKPDNQADIVTHAERLTTGLDSDNLTWDVDDSTSGRIAVSATYTHTLFTGFLWQAFGGNSVTLEASSSMGIER